MVSSHVMNELLETERAYVEELLCVLEVSPLYIYSSISCMLLVCLLCLCAVKRQGYAAEMDKPSMAHLLPSTLLSKKDILFGNMPEIYQFHKTYTYFYLDLLCFLFKGFLFEFGLFFTASRTFLKELEEYTDCPELVGRCFLERVTKRTFTSTKRFPPEELIEMTFLPFLLR